MTCFQFYICNISFINCYLFCHSLNIICICPKVLVANFNHLTEGSNLETIEAEVGTLDRGFK